MGGHKKGKASQRRGLTMIETALALVIMSIVVVASLKFMKQSNENLRMTKEIHFAGSFDKAMKASMIAILDEYENRCSVIPTDTTTNWGWGHPNCNLTSPLPVKSTGGAGDQITYNLQNASTLLQNNIVEQYAPYCVEVSRSTTQLKLRCAGLLNLTYNLGAGAVNAVHGTVTAAGAMTATGVFPQTTAPTYTITYRRVRENGPIVETVTYDGSLLSVWQKRQNYSMEKMKRFEELITSKHKVWLASEVNNPAPTGLNSVDDEFVPWFWRTFGDNAGQVNGTTRCAVSGGICTNLNTNNIWRSGSPVANGLLMRRFGTNAAGVVAVNSDPITLAVDGFGNRVKIVPMMSQCGASNLGTCTTSAPPVPADNYFSGTTIPPYSMAIFADGCEDKTVARPMYCRNIFTF